MRRKREYIFNVYGLALECNRPVPFLTPAGEGIPSETLVHFDESPARFQDFGFDTFAERKMESAGSSVLIERSKDGLTWLILYSDLTCFFLRNDGSRIDAYWSAPQTFEDTLTYLLGPVLACVLHIRRVPVLHASAVVKDGVAFAFIGQSGYGKSTSAALCSQFGCRVLTDDILAISERGGDFWGHSGYPYVRLWSDSARLLFGPTPELPQITPNWDKRHLQLVPGLSFQERPAILSTVYLLDESADGKVALERLRPRHAALELLANKYVSITLNSETAGIEFECFSTMASKIPVKRMSVPYTSESFSVFRDRVLEDFELACRHRTGRRFGDALE